jgi:hypothetical protein
MWKIDGHAKSFYLHVYVVSMNVHASYAIAMITHSTLPLQHNTDQHFPFHFRLCSETRFPQ